MSGYGETYKKELAEKMARAKSIVELADELATIRTIGGRYEIYQTGTTYYVVEIGEGAGETVLDIEEFPEYWLALGNVFERVRRDDEENRAAE